MKFLMGLAAILAMTAGSFADAAHHNFCGATVLQEAADSKGYFWNLATGSSMTMANSFETEAGTVKGAEINVKISKVADGLCTLTAEAGGHSSDTFMGSKDGYFVWGAMTDGKFEAKMRLFKYDAKAGDTWDGWATKEEGQPKVTVKYVGLEEVNVTLGTYKDVIHVQVEVENGPTLDYYFASKMGMIKFTFSVDGKVHRTLQMTAFTDGALIDPKPKK